MRWPWRRQGAIEPRPMVSRAMELQTAKEILAEVFHSRPGEVEEMIWSRLEESGPEERVGGAVAGHVLPCYLLYFVRDASPFIHKQYQHNLHQA